MLAVDEQFEAASVFLFNRTKDMQNKYRQLLLAEAQVSMAYFPLPVFSPPPPQIVDSSLFPFVDTGPYSKKAHQQRW